MVVALVSLRWSLRWSLRCGMGGELERREWSWNEEERRGTQEKADVVIVDGMKMGQKMDYLQRVAILSSTCFAVVASSRLATFSTPFSVHTA